MIDLKDIHLPFDVSELVSSGMALLGFVAPFVLLGLAFIFVVRIISTIFSSFKDNAERDEYGNRKHFRSAESRAHFEQFKKEKGW